MVEPPQAMARATVFVWFMILVNVAPVLVQAGGMPENVGVNWGNIASHPLNPSIVVQMLKDNGIKKVKLFDANSWTLDALEGTNMEVILGIPNDQLHALSDDYDAAKDWVKENVTSYKNKVNIKYVAVGNEPFLRSYNGTFNNPTFPAMKNIQKALNEAGVGNKIKVTSPFNADVYDSSSGKPSDGQFRSDIRNILKQIVEFYKQNGSPFLVNIYPFLSLNSNANFPKEFAFFGDGAKSVWDKGKEYTNVFDANFDTLVWSLKKMNHSDIPIMVGEIGWPTDGALFADNGHAEKFYNGLFKKFAKNSGSPLHPGKVDVYLFGLLDEDQKSVDPGYFERHWGIFRYDGTPKFKMDINGNGNQQFLTGAKGVEYLPNQWCVYNEEADDQDQLSPQVSWACSNADCSGITDNASCGNLDKYKKASYAFNAYYQLTDQNDLSCKFQGLATVVKENPSTSNCYYQTQIVSAGEKGRMGKGAMAVAGFLLGLLLI